MDKTNLISWLESCGNIAKPTKLVHCCETAIVHLNIATKVVQVTKIVQDSVCQLSELQSVSKIVKIGPATEFLDQTLLLQKFIHV